jgi:hypothetical protein
MELTLVAQDPDSVPDGSPALYRAGPQVVDRARLGSHRHFSAGRSEPPGGRDMRRDTRPPDPVLPDPNLMRTYSLDELRRLCRGIQKSFVHLETRDS